MNNEINENPIDTSNWLDELGSSFARNLFKWLSSLTDKYGLNDEDMEYITLVFMYADRRNWNRDEVTHKLAKDGDELANPEFITELFTRFDELKMHSGNI